MMARQRVDARSVVRQSDPSQLPPMLEWVEARKFVVDEVAFVTLGDTVNPADDRLALYRMGAVASSPSQFLIAKSNDMVELYRQLVHDQRPRSIVELGIFRGGSTAFLALAARPEKLIAFEYEAERVAALDELIDRFDLSSRVSLMYGIDQAERARIKQVVARELAGKPLDLVIDDASHQLAQTRASFDTLFPLLRTGGHYVIEDWAWAHTIPDLYDGTSISPLVVEASVACARSRGDVVSSVDVRCGAAVIARGEAPLDPSFQLADWCDERDYAVLGIPPSKLQLTARSPSPTDDR
jgi:predicted O-methyltransferase YrrM